MYHQWYFDLTSKEDLDWNGFKKKLIIKTNELEMEVSNLCDLKEKEFYKMLKKFYAYDEKKSKEIESNRNMVMYFQYKWYFYKLLFKNLEPNEVILKSIYQLDEKNLNHFLKYKQCSDFGDILLTAKHCKPEA